MAGRIALLKSVDSLLGPLAVTLASIFPQKAKRPDVEIVSILLIRPGGIGDAVLLVPLILALKNKYRNSNISVLAERRNASVFRLCPDVDRVLLYDRPSDLLATLQGRYDVVIDTEQWHRLSAVVARLTRAPILVGFDTNDRRRVFNHPVAYSHDDYEAVSFFRLLEPLGIRLQMPDRAFLKVMPGSVERANEQLKSLDGKPFVAIFPGASIPERRWGAERYRQVAVVVSAAGTPVVVVGGKEDQQQGETITEGGRLGLNLAGRTSLVETAAVVEKSCLLLSGDSGVLHIAVGLGKPTVSLFGPGRAKKWAPRGDHHIVINRELPCSPCTTYGTTPPCPSNARCMKEITVKEVADQVISLLSRLGGKK